MIYSNAHSFFCLYSIYQGRGRELLLYSLPEVITSLHEIHQNVFCMNLSLPGLHRICTRLSFIMF